MISQFEIDGIPTLFAPTTGPLRAGLFFRVGFVDEPLARRGITHLIEHLALHSVGVADYHYNGSTDVEHTHFHSQGSEYDVVTFLNGVCASLRDLPIHRLVTEKEILRAETGARRDGIADMLPMWRHGARDYGMSSFPEWGLTGLTPEDLRGWIARYFVRENAVLWITGAAVPAGLKLDLPAGRRQPTPAASSALPVRPASYEGGTGAVVWDTVVRREAPAAVFTGVLERELFRALRQEGGLSYTVQTDYETRADGSAVITALADALPDKQGAVLGGFVDVLAAMRIGRIDPADVTAVVNKRCEALRQIDEQGGRLPGQATALLSGRPVQSLDEVLAEYRAVTPARVAAVAAAAYANGLLQTPGDTGADWAGYADAPTASAAPIVGTTYPSLESPHVRLVLGEQGVSVVRGPEPVTVRFDACAGVLAWPDGARRLIGLDGIVVPVEPTLYSGAAATIAWLDAKLPYGLRVDMPARDPERIPQPRPAGGPASPPVAGSRAARSSRWSC